MRVIFQLLQKNFSEDFCPVYVIFWLLRIWTYKNTDEKEHIFSPRKKYTQNGQKRTKKRILRKSTVIVAVIFLDSLNVGITKKAFKLQ